MQRAIFRTSLDHSGINHAEGVVPRVILAELGKMAVYSGKDGKPVEVKVTEKLIGSILKLAKEEARLDAYWTHDRLNPENENKDPLHSFVGTWTNFDTNEKGDLVADVSLMPTEYKEAVLWAAEKDKKAMMTSLVFDYRGGRDNAEAIRLISGDFVKQGAATTALLSQHTNNNMLTKEEIEDIVSAKFSALSKEMEAKLAEIEIEVDEKDKEGESEDMPAVMKAVRRFAKASKRQAGDLSAKLSAVEAENKELKDQIAKSADEATAKFTSMLGKSAAVNLQAKTADNDPETAILSRMKSLPEGKNTRAHAKADLARTNPELYAKL